MLEKETLIISIYTASQMKWMNDETDLALQYT